MWEDALGLVAGDQADEVQAWIDALQAALPGSREPDPAPPPADSTSPGPVVRVPWNRPSPPTAPSSSWVAPVVIGGVVVGSLLLGGGALLLLSTRSR